MITRIGKLLRAEQVRTLRALLQAAEFEDGRNTASGQAAAVKRNLQLPRESPARRQADQIVSQAIQASARFREVTFARTLAPPTYNRYDVGMEYGSHVDAPFVSDGKLRADISMTIFLSDPADYDGGELVLEEGAAETRVKYEAGDAVVYPTTARHYVAPVTRGSRLAAVSWIQSFVPEPERRRILVELQDAKAEIEERLPEAESTLLLRNAFYNLVRMWWQP
ncbi:MAG TPA: Fe2+-dependent dioxygenase [Alphaproteobacteria bacterium]|jgi:PKHD-type hydroxylase|nr:Fe2+-dependent dioxygenase [Alphaproteobacteria bacterium]